MFSYDSPYDDIDEKYYDRMDSWTTALGNEFESAVRSVVDRERFLNNVASAIALAIYDYGDCKEFADEYGITPEHALCYLSCTNGSHYDKQIAEAYREFLEGCAE